MLHTDKNTSPPPPPPCVLVLVLIVLNLCVFAGGELEPAIEVSLIEHWEADFGPEYEIVVAQLSKFREGGGLGISLEGTVDVENGVEVRPHHYIRSVLIDGPVGKNGRLQSSDELLEVRTAGYRAAIVKPNKIISA